MTPKLLGFLLVLPLLAADSFDPAWSRVLSRFVDARGQVDFAGLAKAPADLDAQTAFIARTEPSSLPDHRTARLAYYLNAYNALAMSHAVHSGLLPKSKIRFFYLSKFNIGGKKMSLHSLENDVIRPLGEPRVHFALNCMVRSCPRLAREPFSAGTLEAQLEAAAREFFSSPHHVDLDEAAKTVSFNPILKWYKDDFLAVEPSLIAYANRYRDHKIPESFKPLFLPYDWTLNAQP